MSIDENTIVTNTAGERYAYPNPDGGPSEQRIHRETRGQMVAEVDLIHARHEDAGCPVCADNHVGHRALQEDEKRLRQAYQELQRGIFLLVRPLREPDLFAEHPQVDLSELLAELDRLSTRVGRIFRGDR